jgi:hypothetical protein
MASKKASVSWETILVWLRKDSGLWRIFEVFSLHVK